jgi:hypothetical protein
VPIEEEEEEEGVCYATNQPSYVRVYFLYSKTVQIHVQCFINVLYLTSTQMQEMEYSGIRK